MTTNIGNLTGSSHVRMGSTFTVRDDIDTFSKMATVLEVRGKILFIRYDSPGSSRPFYGTGRITHNYLGDETIMPDPIRSLGIFNLTDAYEKYRTMVEIHEDLTRIREFDKQLTLKK